MNKQRGKYKKNFIREMRDDRGISLEQLAEHMNMTNQQVSNIELSKSRLSTDQLYKFAKALECHPLDITEGPDNVLPNTDEEKDALKLFKKLSDIDQQRFLGRLQNATEDD